MSITNMVFRKPSRAFTLVELLVVVAIIALLLAILLPSLNKATEQANITVCLTNLKGLGATFVAYTTTNNYWYPGGAGWGGDPPHWDDRLQPYFNAFGLLYCPSDDLSRDKFYEHIYRIDPKPDYPRSYAINISVSYRGPSIYGDECPHPPGDGSNPYTGSDGIDETPFTATGSVHKATDVEQPDETILLGDEWESWYYNGDSEPWPSIYDSYRGHGIYDGMWSGSVPHEVSDGPSCRSPTFYHRNKTAANFLFCDGHANLLSKDDERLNDINGNGTNDPEDMYYYKLKKP